MRVLRMAWRNVWRSGRRSLVTTAAMTFGLMFMILYSGLVEGYLEGLERNILDLEMGDVQIHVEGYRNKPALYKLIKGEDQIIEQLSQDGYPASGRLLGSALAAAGDVSTAVELRGIDPQRDAKVSAVHEHLAEGRWLSVDDPHGVVLGKRLARALNVHVGDDFVLVGQGGDGSMANDLFVVRGILQSIADGVDTTGVYMTQSTFRELMVVPHGVHEIIVRRPQDVPLKDAVSKIRSIAPDYEVLSWRALVPTMARMLDGTRGSMLIMYIIIYLVLGILLLNAMLMAVFERAREFGVLKAIGVSPWGVVKLVFTESAIMATAGLVLGTALSIPGLLYLRDHGIDLTAISPDVSISGIAWDPIWRAVINPNTFISPVVTMFTVVTLAIIYPTIRAALIAPVEAMRQS